MKSKHNNCKRSLAKKRCVFRVRSKDKQEMLQSRTLLSESNLRIMVNNRLERPCPLNVRACPRTLKATETAFLPQIFENHTVH